MRLINDCDCFIVPSVAISPVGERSKIIDISINFEEEEVNEGEEEADVDELSSDSKNKYGK